MNRTTNLLVLAAGLLLAAAGSLGAQTSTATPTPKAFTACYVPLSGTVYLVGEPNTPTDCVRTTHIKFKWTDGPPGWDYGVMQNLLSDHHTQYVRADGSRGLSGDLSAGGFRITGLGPAQGPGDAVSSKQAIKTGDAAGGDLAGTYPDPTVDGLQTHPVAPDAPTLNQVLTWNGTAWAPATPPTPAAATPENVPTTIVQRDATGGFRAGPVTLTRLDINGTPLQSGFVVRGVTGGAIPETGAGARLMWHAGKAAFRAGQVTSTQWDDANIGFGSTALGFRTIATGDFSTAMGADATASGSVSIAMGNITTASGAASTAIGFKTTATGHQSTAIGSFASTNLQEGAFVHGDASTGATGALVTATAPNQFVVRASGGFRFRTSPDLSTGCDIAAGALSCSGTVASSSGGFKFPDGTTQMTAATGGESGTSANTANTLVRRDASGGFTAGPVTLTRLDINGTSAQSGFVVRGVTGGAIPETGAGTRLMWYPGKAAFRAGEALGAEWDDVNVGTLSAAMGRKTTASGAASTALGNATTASGFNSTALGQATTASGDQSTAMGSNTTASGSFSTALGFAASTNGHTGSFVYGDASTGQLPVVATAPNQFVVRAAGGFRFRTASDLTTGCDIAGGALSCSGTVASASGGFKFPDGTTQTTAATGGESGTSANTANTLVRRDASGGFAAGPVTLTQLDVNGSVVVKGVTAGDRLVWFPGKAAFRAGRAEGTQWDDVHVGSLSTAMGLNTTASGHYSTALGLGTSATGLNSTAIGASTASGDFSTAMGSSTTASGARSTAMGSSTTASGDFSTTMGLLATADFRGSFVYGDASTLGTTNTRVTAAGENRFVVRAAGGTIFYSNSDLTAGVSLAPGASAWATVSDVNRKEHFREVDGKEVLEQIARMPIRAWSYKAQDPSIRHLGPTAQDFYAAFGLGESDTTITTTDIDGVNLLAVQALERRTAELRDKVRELEAVRAGLERRLAVLEAAFARLSGSEREP